MKRRSAWRIWKSPFGAFFVLAAFLALTAFAAPASADSKSAALVIDANTGRTLFAENAGAHRFPASLTKMMTLYVLFEDLDAKRLSLNSTFTVSALAARQPPSKLGLKAGSSIKVEDAILALVTKSANDIAVVVAEGVEGSVTDFVTRMNLAARTLGMTDTVFRNPNGLPDSAQHTTAHDLAILAQALQDRFPTYYKYFATPSFTYRGVRHRNHDHLLGSVQGVDGIKTGYTRASGFNLVTNVVRGNRHIIAVVMGGRTARVRDVRMRELIATYISKASSGRDRTPPIIVADTGGSVTDPRLPRARPDDDGSSDDSTVLSYAAAEGSHDVVAAAMAEAAASQGDAAGDDSAVADPIAMRIASASAIAEFADISITDGANDPIARLTELARIRAGEADVVAGPAGVADSAASGDPGWRIQIGAVPTEEGAHALIDQAQQAMGPAFNALQPVTQAVEHNGTTLYRARFAGFDDKDQARAMCDKLKQKDFACLAVPG